MPNDGRLNIAQYTERSAKIRPANTSNPFRALFTYVVLTLQSSAYKFLVGELEGKIYHYENISVDGRLIQNGQISLNVLKI